MLLRCILFLSAFALAQAAATCYFSDGDISPADTPCDDEATDTFCCFNRQACLSNKICLTGNVNGVDQYARGTCTDQSWVSGECPNFCLDSGALGNVMFSCNVTGVDKYCCNDGCSCDAAAGDEVVSFTGTPYTISVIGITSVYTNPSTTASSAVSSVASSASSADITSGVSGVSSAASSASSAPPSSQSSIVTSSVVNSASQSTSPTSGTAASAATSAAVSTSSSSGGSSNGVAIGAGVGVGVGVGILLLGAAGFFFYRRRNKKGNIERTHTDPPAPHHVEKPAHTSPHAPLQETKYQPPIYPNASELSPIGHEYSEMGTHTTSHTELPSRRSEAAELPGQ